MYEGKRKFMEGNREVHIAGTYTIVASIIGAIVGAVAMYFVSPGDEVSRKEYNELYSYYEEALSDIDELKEENESLKTENESLKTENESLKIENESLKGSEDPYVQGGDPPSPNEHSARGINIFEQQAMSGSDGSFTFSTSGAKDNVGNGYPGGYSILYQASGVEERYIIYKIGGEYSSLNGTIALHAADSNIEDGVWIEFYGDNEFLGATEHLYEEIEPIDFDFDISGVDHLKIVVKGGSHSAIILTNGFYLK